MDTVLWIAIGIAGIFITFNLAFLLAVLIILTSMMNTQGSGYSSPVYNLFSFEADLDDVRQMLRLAGEDEERLNNGEILLPSGKAIEINHRIRKLYYDRHFLNLKERRKTQTMWYDITNDAMAIGIDPGIFNDPY